MYSISFYIFFNIFVFVFLFSYNIYILFSQNVRKDLKFGFKIFNFFWIVLFLFFILFLYTLLLINYNFDLDNGLIFEKLLIVNFPFYKLIFILDNLSLYFILLLQFLILIILFLFKNLRFNNLQNNFDLNSKVFDIFQYLLFLLLLYFIVFIFFITYDILVFYIFFELSMIPLYFLINLFGKRSRRFHASYYLYYYTFISSCGFLLGILYLYQKFGTVNILLLNNFYIEKNIELVLWILFFFPFATKLPMIPFHLWLPEAHVEASTEGSVLLAGLLLKLGGYGFLRILLNLFSYSSYYFSSFICILALISIFYASFAIYNQIDLKKIIAYFSIIHMNFFILGLFSSTLEGVLGALFLLLSHGLISSSFFILVGFIYERFHSRNIYYLGGLTEYMPRLSALLFLVMLSNISFPGTSSFISELLIFFGFFDMNIVLFIFLILITSLPAIFSVIIYVKMIYGVPYNYISKYSFTFFNTLKKKFFIIYKIDLTYYETLVVGLLLYISFLLGLFPNFYLNFLQNALVFLLFIF